MRIVVNAAFMPENNSRDYIDFLAGSFRRITKNHSQHHFIFICEEKWAELFLNGNNVEVHRIKSRKASAVLWKYWYDVRIPYYLRKYKANLFFSPAGFCSLNTKVPQCIMTGNLSFLQFPSFYTRANLFFYKNHTRKSIQKAKRIITLSEFTKEEIINGYKVDVDAIDVIRNGITDGYSAPTDMAKEEIKKKYTEGKEYFLYTGVIHPSANLINLLKAFSLFKKRQQSNLKLVICGNRADNDKSFTRLLKTYKYRSEINVLIDIPAKERATLISSAYALADVAFANIFYTAIIQAMQSNTPVITSINPAMQEITDGAALYVDPQNPRDIAEAMMQLYKNEKLRNELTVKGGLVGDRYNIDKTAEQLWQVIQKVL
jgi:glycosyltransferase involved in cell wall biosynthesis